MKTDTRLSTYKDTVYPDTVNSHCPSARITKSAFPLLTLHKSLNWTVCPGHS